MTLRIEQVSEKRGTRIQLSGDLRSEHLDDVRAEIKRSHPRVTLDLEEVDGCGYRFSALPEQL
jgi:hypothetical protein